MWKIPSLKCCPALTIRLLTTTVSADINASHEATGYTGRTDLHAFHIFTMESTYPATRQVMPPYTRGFHQVMMLENSSDASINVNAEKVQGLSDIISCFALGHVSAQRYQQFIE